MASGALPASLLGSPNVATASALGDPSIRSDLSVPVLDIVKTIDMTAGLVSGLGTSISSVGVDALMSAVGPAIADTVGEMAKMVPLIGAVVGIFVKVLGGAFPSAEEKKQACSDACQAMWGRLPVDPSGSLFAGERTTPADIFARTHGVAMPLYIYGTDKSNASESMLVASHAREKGTPASLQPFLTFARSMLGCTLMQVTEGCVVDVELEIDAKKLLAKFMKGGAWLPGMLGIMLLPDSGIEDVQAKFVEAWEKAIDREQAHVIEASKPFAKLMAALPGEKPEPELRPMPRAWRQRFRRLRRGIEASWKSGGDGGTALWMIYLDLLTKAFREGYLSEMSCGLTLIRAGGEHTLTRLAVSESPYTTGAIGWPGNAEGPKRFVQVLSGVKADDLDVYEAPLAPATWVFGCNPCSSISADRVIQLAKAWQDSISPFYASGQKIVGDIDAKAKALATTARTTRDPLSDPLKVGVGVGAVSLTIAALAAAWWLDSKQKPIR